MQTTPTHVHAEPVYLLLAVSCCHYSHQVPVASDLTSEATTVHRPTAIRLCDYPQLQHLVGKFGLVCLSADCWKGRYTGI